MDRIRKTDRMLLIEARAGRDVREVLREVYRDSGGNYGRAAALIDERYGVALTFGLFSDWVEQFGGRRCLEFPAAVISEEVAA